MTTGILNISQEIKSKKVCKKTPSGGLGYNLLNNKPLERCHVCCNLDFEEIFIRRGFMNAVVILIFTSLEGRYNVRAISQSHPILLIDLCS